MNKDNKAECDVGFFDWSCVNNNGGGDVYYTFKGVKGGCLKGGVNNALYGSRENISELYRCMVSDISDYVMSDEFLDKFKDSGSCIGDKLNQYTTNKYGVSYGWVYNKINGTNYGHLGTDIIFEEMIRYKGGLDRIDWMGLYEKNKGFSTNRSDILLYIANRIISGSIYKYFVDRYKLKAVGVDVNVHDRRLIVLEWEGGRRLIPLSTLIWNKSDWWRRMSYNDKSKIDKDRTKIRDYDRLLNGRSEDDVLPDVCPIDNNIVLNYTRIDFSGKNDNNLDECKSHDGMKTWSSASVDRIDSTKPYSYDNIEIISQYYNTQVKNCASIVQTGKLHYHQLRRQLKSIDNKSVKIMDDNQLEYLFDCMGFTANILENICDKKRIILKEMEKRDKKRSKV